MFGLEWSEIAVIGIVALIAIGPKDLPVAIRAITTMLKKLRRMAGEFQHHVDDMMRDAELQEVSSTLRDLRGMGLRNAVNRVVDPSGDIGRAFTDPFETHPVRQPVMTEQTVAPREVPQPAGPAPAFIPPNAAYQAPVQPPAFIPPGQAEGH
jgi:sec-independent protein translocase protein TatB